MKKLEISKSDLKYNLDSIKNILEETGSNTQIIAVVKANGMGLDLIQYSKFLIENGIEILAVANVEEAIELRKSGIKAEILMLTPISLKKELQILTINDITITIGSYNEFELAEEIAKSLNKSINAHIKIDTGFGRYGFLDSEKEIVLECFKKATNVKIKGMYTHFSNAIDEKYTKEQYNKFINVVNYIKENDYNIDLLHCSASTAFLKYPDMRLNCIRIRFCNSRKNTFKL